MKRGLGKGLDSIIPNKQGTIEQKQEKKGGEKTEKLAGRSYETLVDISEIEPNGKQPRKKFDEDALTELSESIRQVGIIQPLILQKKEDHYEIIAGERRFRAAKLAGIKKIPAMIREYSPQQVLEIALIENIQREDLNPIEEAQAYQRLIKEFKLKQDEVAEKVAKSRSAVTNSLRLLKLSKKVQEMLVEEDLEEQMKQLLGTKVSIRRKNENQGKIEIEYYSEEELDRILSYLRK